MLLNLTVLEKLAQRQKEAVYVTGQDYVSNTGRTAIYPRHAFRTPEPGSLLGRIGPRAGDPIEVGFSRTQRFKPAPSDALAVAVPTAYSRGGTYERWQGIKGPLQDESRGMHWDSDKRRWITEAPQDLPTHTIMVDGKRQPTSTFVSRSRPLVRQVQDAEGNKGVHISFKAPPAAPHVPILAPKIVTPAIPAAPVDAAVESSEEQIQRILEEYGVKKRG
jgi:hypothetical protein